VLAGGNVVREAEGRGLLLAVHHGFFELVLSVDRRSNDVQLECVKDDLA
jgi:hypothetical protein